jgi:hypothetical protein
MHINSQLQTKTIFLDMKYFQNNDDDIQLNGTNQPCFIQRNVHGAWVCFPGDEEIEPQVMITTEHESTESRILFPEAAQRRIKRSFIIPYTIRRRGRQEKRFSANGGLLLSSDKDCQKESFIFTLRRQRYKSRKITQKEEAIILRAIIPDDNDEDRADMTASMKQEQEVYGKEVKILWKTNLLHTILSMAVCQASQPSVVVVGCSSGEIGTITLKDGTLIWLSTPLISPVTGLPVLPLSIAVSGINIAIGTSEGLVHIFELQGLF